MASPSAAERVYFRIEQALPQTAGRNPESFELTGVPLRGMVRRIRFTTERLGVPLVVNITFALSEGPFTASTLDPAGGELDLISLHDAQTQPPIDLIGRYLENSQGTGARGNQGIPFQLTPSSPGSRTGTLYLAWSTSVPNPDTTFQLTIEPLVP